MLRGNWFLKSVNKLNLYKSLIRNYIKVEPTKDNWTIGFTVYKTFM